MSLSAVICDTFVAVLSFVTIFVSLCTSHSAIFLKFIVISQNWCESQTSTIEAAVLPMNIIMSGMKSRVLTHGLCHVSPSFMC